VGQERVGPQPRATRASIAMPRLSQRPRQLPHRPSYLTLRQQCGPPTSDAVTIGAANPPAQEYNRYPIKDIGLHRARQPGWLSRRRRICTARGQPLRESLSAASNQCAAHPASHTLRQVGVTITSTNVSSFHPWFRPCPRILASTRARSWPRCSPCPCLYDSH
jgi:hypothetical protein